MSPRSVRTGGTVIARIDTVVFSPVITRLYGLEAFGVLGVFLSVTLILSTLSSLCYVHAVVLPKEDTTGLRIIHLSFKIAAIILTITAGIIIPLKREYRRFIRYASNCPLSFSDSLLSVSSFPYPRV